MTDLTDEAVKALLDGATPGPFSCQTFEVSGYVYGPGGNVIAEVFGAIGGKASANTHLFNAAPNLARMYLAARADTEAAVALALQEAAERLTANRAQLNFAAMLGLLRDEPLPEQIVSALSDWLDVIADAIRALAPASGVAKLEELRAARDEWKRLAVAGEITARHMNIVEAERAALSAAQPAWMAGKEGAE